MPPVTNFLPPVATRRDGLSGPGWPPEKSTDRLHGANGVAVGHDGWLYFALGDRGCDVPRPEGDRLVLHGGGILRCRPDGTDLHVEGGRSVPTSPAPAGAFPEST